MQKPSARLQKMRKHCQGQISAQGILHLRNPNFDPNSGKRILGARILDPNSWVEFFEPVFFPAKEAPRKIQPQEIHLSKFTFQNSTQKSGQKFTLHLCRAFWLKHCDFIQRPRKCSGNAEGSRIPWVIKFHGRLGCWFISLWLRDHSFSLQKEAVLSPCNFATGHLIAFILNFYLPWTSRPIQISQRCFAISSVIFSCDFSAISSRAAKRGCFKRGGFPIWTCPSFFVLFGTFPIFPGFSRFARGWSGDFPNLSFFILSQPIKSTYTRNSPERVRDTIWTFPERSVGNTRVWKHPGLASLNEYLKWPGGRRA